MDYAFNDSTTQMVAESDEQTILIPLIKLKKRVMLDNFEIKDSDGRHVAPLLQEEANGLIARVITNLFRLAFLGDSPEEIDRKLSDAEERLRWSLINLACHVDSVSAETKNSILSLLDAQPINVPDAGKASVADPGKVSVADPGRVAVADTSSLDSLRRFCQLCADHYLIIVEADLSKGEPSFAEIYENCS